MIYLDYNATTPVAKEAADAMLPFLYENYGNPSSSHRMGREAKTAVEEARQRVASLLNCSPGEFVFTGSGSESNNTVIKGVAEACREKGNHIITSRIEHPAVLNPCAYLERRGWRITRLPVDSRGMVSPEDLIQSLTPETVLVIVMHSNNETGTLQPVREIGRICRSRDILFHTDASQSVGKVPVDVKDLQTDFLTLAGHKLYAPKGIGGFFIRKGLSIEPLIHGAGHEQGRRAGTENVIFIVGLGKACELAEKALKSSRLRELTDRFLGEMEDAFGDRIRLNGSREHRLPNTLNISFAGYTSGEIMGFLGDAAVSAGSACHSGSTTLSPVLKAMGVTDEEGRGTIRFSLGRYTTPEETGEVIRRLKAAL